MEAGMRVQVNNELSLISEPSISFNTDYSLSNPQQLLSPLLQGQGGKDEVFAQILQRLLTHNLAWVLADKCLLRVWKGRERFKLQVPSQRVRSTRKVEGKQRYLTRKNVEKTGNQEMWKLIKTNSISWGRGWEEGHSSGFLTSTPLRVLQGAAEELLGVFQPNSEVPALFFMIGRILHRLGKFSSQYWLMRLAFNNSQQTNYDSGSGISGNVVFFGGFRIQGWCLTLGTYKNCIVV